MKQLYFIFSETAVSNWEKIAGKQVLGKEIRIVLDTCQVKHPYEEASALLESFCSFAGTYAAAVVMLFASSSPFLMDSLLF